MLAAGQGQVSDQQAEFDEAEYDLGRVRDGRLVVLREEGLDISDGAYACEPSTLSGILVLECADLDSAIEWVARLPALRHSAVELRPFKDAGV